AKALCLLSRSSKVSRRKGGTLSGRYRRNGYVLDQQFSGRKAAIASKLAPTRFVAGLTDAAIFPTRF
ncbi:hypothetical protein, partial [Pseudomonas sp. FW305-28]|uniref:hypothetical protein n=1 Tax=Pseudomonas sp. FW305-28 TaxID=2751326 RepID=UPI001A9395D7